MDYPGKVITKTQVTPTQTSASGNWTLDDQAAAIKNNNWPVALVPNPISKSLRFNSADSAYLNRTPASAGSRTTWTLSAWVKRGAIGVNHAIISCGSYSTDLFQFYFEDATNSLRIQNFPNSTTANVDLLTSAVYRDLSAWYHIVAVMDTTQATSSNRVKLYVNGSQVTAFSTATYPAQNATPNWNTGSLAHLIGARSAGVLQYSGYMTEMNFIDGQALTPSDFGLTNPQTGQWIPKKYTGTYGTNGFYLNFKDATSTTTLGYDYSGNANNWTTNNFSVTAGSGNDSLTDVPTPWVAYNTTGDVGGVFRGNYCTVNPLDANANVTLSNGNLDIATGSSYGGCRGTIAVSSGKWYWEVTPTSLTGGASIGIWDTSEAIGTNNVGATAKSYSYWNNGQKQNNNTNSAYGASYTTNDVIGVALDLDAGTLVFYKNNSSQGTAFSSLSGNFAPGFGDTAAASSSNLVTNFGQRPFAYTPPTGFRSLCTTNLPATTIGFGLTNQANKYMNVVTFSGNGSAGSVTGVGFQPDFIWAKNRTNAYNNELWDVTRGVNSTLFSNATSAEDTTANRLVSFNSDGFSYGTSSNLYVNATNSVAWNWKAGGTGVTNTAGTITSTVSANTTAGFSIVTYTGNGSANQTVGHGLGVAPAFGILKDRDPNSNNDQWQVFHTGAGDKYGYLSTTAAFAGTAEFYPTSGSSTTVTIARGSPAATTNESGDRYVMYLFAPVAGYSAFGSYTGNGSADGVFVYTGFRPRFILFKQSSAAGNDWYIYDAVRSTYNVATHRLFPNSSAAEATNFNTLDILSNGWKVRDSNSAWNASGATYIYAAFAEFPFQFANAR